jgi:hypothetical protein
MNSDADKEFDLIANKLRKKKGLCPPTPDEAAKAFKKARPIPISDEERDSIVDAMLSGQNRIHHVEPSEPWRSTPLDQEIDADCEAICRNPGEEDEETKQLEADIAEKLLAEDDEEV